MRIVTDQLPPSLLADGKKLLAVLTGQGIRVTERSIGKLDRFGLAPNHRIAAFRQCPQITALKVRDLKHVVISIWSPTSLTLPPGFVPAFRHNCMRIGAIDVDFPDSSTVRLPVNDRKSQPTSIRSEHRHPHSTLCRK